MGGSGSKTTTSTTNNTPWAPQATQLEYMLQQARGLYDQQKAAGMPYQGTYYAQMDPATQQALSNMEQQSGVMSAAGAGLAGTGANLVSAGSGYGNTAANMAAGNFGAAGSTTPLQSMNQGALSKYAMQSMGANTQGLNATMAGIQRAGTDQTGAIVNNAGQMINNDVINGQIDAVNRDVGRTLAEDTLPTLNRQASMGGNLNSSRAGAAEAIAMRGAQDRMADNAASIRSAAYNDALKLSQDQNQFGTNALMSGGKSLMDTAATGADASNSLASLLEGARGMNLKAMLAANGQSGDALKSGANLVSGGLDLTNQGNQLLGTVGSARQEEAQNILNDMIAQADAGNAWDWSQLAKLQQFASDDAMQGYGTTTGTEKVSTKNGWLQTAMGVTSMIASLMSSASGDKKKF